MTEYEECEFDYGFEAGVHHAAAIIRNYVLRLKGLPYEPDVEMIVDDMETLIEGLMKEA